MSSLIEIAKIASTRMGTDATITSLDDNRNLARTLKDVWEAERRATLRESSFNFATRRAALAQITSDEAGVIFPFTAAFNLPTDCLRLYEVLDPVARTSYQNESGRILCNTGGPLYIRYIWDVTELALWDDAGALAFGLRLAWRCGRKIAGSSFDLDQCWQEYREAIGAAKSVDAKENPPIEEEESDWVLARLRYGSA